MLLVALQFKHPDFEDAIGIVGFLLAVLAMFHILFMFYLIYDIVFRKHYLTNKERAEKYGAFFAGLKENSKYAVYVLVLKMIQKLLIVIVIVAAFTSPMQLLPILVVSGIVFLFELVVRPYKSIFVFISSILLSLMLMAIILMAYMVQ